MCNMEERVKRVYKNADIIGKMLAYTSDVLEGEPPEIKAAFVFTLISGLDMWTDKQFAGMLAERFCEVYKEDED